jgi:hypothetical protein
MRGKHKGEKMEHNYKQSLYGKCECHDCLQYDGKTVRVVLHFVNAENDRVVSDVTEVLVPENGTLVLRTLQGDTVSVVLANLAYWETR